MPERTPWLFGSRPPTTPPTTPPTLPPPAPPALPLPPEGEDLPPLAGRFLLHLLHVGHSTFNAWRFNAGHAGNPTCGDVGRVLHGRNLVTCLKLVKARDPKSRGRKCELLTLTPLGAKVARALESRAGQ